MFIVGYQYHYNYYHCHSHNIYNIYIVNTVIITIVINTHHLMSNK